MSNGVMFVEIPDVPLEGVKVTDVVKEFCERATVGENRSGSEARVYVASAQG